MTPKEKIEALYEGIAFFYPGLVYGPDAPTNDQDKIKYEGRTVSKKEFLNIVFEFTKTIDINLALKKLLELRETIDEIRPEEQPDRTAPENLKELVDQEEKARAKKTKEKAQRPAKTKQRAQQIKEALKEKIVYAEPKDATEKVPPTPQEEYVLKKLTESAIKNRRVFVTKLSEQIVKNAPPEIRKDIPPEQLELSAKQIALDFSERLINKTPVAPPGVFAAIADPAANLEKIISSPLAVNQIHEDGVVFTALSERSDFTTRTLLYPVLGENVTGLVYGPAQETYILTFEPTDKTAYTVNLSELHENATDFQSGPVYQSINNPLLDIAKDKLFSFGKEKILSKFNILPKGGAFGFISRFSSSGTFDSAISLLARSQTQYIATNIVGKFVTTFLPQYTEIIGGVANFLKLNIGLAPVVASAVPTTAITAGVLTTEAVAAGAAKPVAAKIAGGAVSTAIGKGVAAVAIKLGLSATLAQTLGTVLPIIGHAIGFVLGTLVQKLTGWLKKNPDTAIGIGAAVLVGGLLVQSPVLIIGGAATLAVGGFARGALTVGVVAGGILLFGRRLGKSLAITVGLPIIIMIAVTPIIVYFILFIINSGAYIVPPETSQVPGSPGSMESRFLRVEKTATPSGPFTNGQLPLGIEYKVTITAKKSTLTNIRFDNTYSISQEPMLATPPQPTIPGPPKNISPTQPYAFTYQVTFGQEFKDSIVTDNFKVVADSPESKDNVAIGVATIVIGTPPEDCPSGWPVLTNQGQKYFVMQGPHAPCTHGGSYPDREAIDVQVYPPDRSITANDFVIATHKGNIVSMGVDGWGGLYVDTLGSCGGQPYRSRHVHFSSLSSGLSRGVIINRGTILGIMGKTGSAYKPHDHYEFREAQRGGSDASGNPPVRMIVPFIPKSVPNRCCGDCNVSIP